MNSESDVHVVYSSNVHDAHNDTEVLTHDVLGTFASTRSAFEAGHGENIQAFHKGPLHCDENPGISKHSWMQAPRSELEGFFAKNYGHGKIFLISAEDMKRLERSLLNMNAWEKTGAKMTRFIEHSLK